MKIQTFLLSLISPYFTKALKGLLVKRAECLDAKEYKYTVGQPMAALSSWLCWLLLIT